MPERDDWIRDEFREVRREMGVMGSEIHRKIESSNKDMRAEIKPIARLVNMAIGAWTIMVLIIGIIGSKINEVFPQGKH